MYNLDIGAFRGRVLIQRKGELGGARSVFVKLQGNKNELTYPSIGGMIKNPPKGASKMFAGDLCEYRTNADGVKPEVYLLRTFLVHKLDATESSTKIYIIRDGFKHIPFVGDTLGVAPATIGGAVATNAVVTAVSKEVVDGKDVWGLTMSKALTGAKKDDVLVEVGTDGKMLVKAINAVIDADCDMLYNPANGADDFEGARYMYTPALGGVMYISKMSPMPACVLALNQSKINGWFKIQSV